MANPILSQILKTQMSPINSKMSNIGNIINLLKGNPNALMSQVNNNPQFQQFVNANKGKTPQQIASEYGIDYNQVLNILGNLK